VLRGGAIEVRRDSAFSYEVWAISHASIDSFQMIFRKKCSLQTSAFRVNLSALLKRTLNRLAIVFASALFGVATATASDFQGATHLVPLDEDIIDYAKAQPDSAISRLQKKLESGAATLGWDESLVTYHPC
jgi:hypothetical protein